MWDVKWYKDALLVNRDADWTFRIIKGETAGEMRESVDKYFSIFGGHKITDVLLNVYEQSSFIPTDKITWIGSRHGKCEGFEKDAYYPVVEKLYKACIEFGIDYVDMFIRKMEEIGIRPWLTLRMNDSHYLTEGVSLLQSEEYHKELAAGHVIGEEYGYFGKNPDFSYPGIREALLAYIEEILGKYDFFGLELDFMREIDCFDYRHNPDGHKIMTEFVRQVKSKITAAEKRVGHRIMIMIRTHRSPKDALEFGFDIKTMCRERLIDAVNPTPRWECTDSAIPIAEWREICGDDIAVFPGLETLHLDKTRVQPEHAKAYAAAFYAQGADGLYLNNYFDGGERDLGVWNIDRCSCTSGRREFTVTYQDIASGSYPSYRPLPLSFDGEGKIELEIGRVCKDNKVTVVVDFAGDTPPMLSAAGITDAVPVQIEPVVIPKNAYFGGEAVMTPNTPLSYDLSGIETESPITLSFGGVGTIHYITIIIESK